MNYFERKGTLFLGKKGERRLKLVCHDARGIRISIQYK